MILSDKQVDNLNSKLAHLEDVSKLKGKNTIHLSELRSDMIKGLSRDMNDHIIQASLCLKNIEHIMNSNMDRKP